MESQKNKIQIEYSLFETDAVSSENDVLVMLFDSSQEVEKERQLIQTRVNVNERTRRFSSLVSSRMRGLLNLYCPEYYEDDSDYLIYKDVVLGRYFDQVVRMISGVDSTNYQEMSKLASFIQTKCVVNCESIEKRRIANRQFYGEETRELELSNDDSTAVTMFFEEEFARIVGMTKQDKGPQKQKK